MLSFLNAQNNAMKECHILLIISWLQGVAEELSSVTRYKSKTLLPLAHERRLYFLCFYGV
jgi:hypothetical protein